MTQKPKIDDTTLHAYVDAELDASAAAEVEAWLQENPEDRSRVEDWRRQSIELKRQFDPVIAEPLPPEWIRLLNENKRTRWAQWGKPAIAASLVFALGASGGWYLARGDRAEVAARELIADQALSAHLVYVSEIRHPVEVSVSDSSHLVGWLSKRLGQPLSPPDFSAAGYRLMGGRLLAADAKPAAQFMYENESGQRITLYVAANPGGQETAFQIVDIGSAKSFYWLDGPLGFAITGDLEQSDLLIIARSAYEQLSL